MTNGVNNETAKNYVHISMFGKKVCSYETQDIELVTKLNSMNKDNMHIVAKEIIPILMNSKEQVGHREIEIERLQQIIQEHLKEKERALHELHTNMMQQLDIQMERRRIQKEEYRKLRIEKGYQRKIEQEHMNTIDEIVNISMEHFFKFFADLEKNHPGDEEYISNETRKYIEMREFKNRLKLDTQRHNEKTMIKFIKTKLTSKIAFSDLCDEDDYW